MLCGAIAGAQTAPRAEPVRVFLDCQFCDFDYLQVETPWVAFVRDRTAGDVHVLLVRHRGENRIPDDFCSVDHLLEWAKAGGRWQ